MGLILCLSVYCSYQMHGWNNRSFIRNETEVYVYGDGGNDGVIKGENRGRERNGRIGMGGPL